MNNTTARQPVSRGDRTRRQLIEGALETLKQEGFAGATSRAIARVGGFNQALIFYHFGGVEPLLLAALDATSEERMSRYRRAFAGVESLEELARVARRMYEEDRASGHMTVVSQMVAGSLARPELAPEVLARMEPWIEFAEEAIATVLRGTPLENALPTRELAYAAVTFYLGVNLLTNLDPEPRRADLLFERLTELAPTATPFLDRQ
jgi:AcrR family transcriptional regulator